MVKRAIAAGLGVLVLLMAITNPNSDRYADYGVERIKESQESICPQSVPILGGLVREECQSFIKSNSDTIKQVILKTTDRQNLLLFSIYRTDLSLNKIIPNLPENVAPSYKIETIAAFGNFVTYEAEKN